MSAAARPPAGPSARPRGEFLPGDRILTSGRRGVVHFFGLVAFATGKYVGIELEEPAGKHDGSMKGERYFTCPPNHGVFVKPSMVQLDPDAVQPTPASAAASRVASRAGSRRPSIDEGAAPVAAAADTAPASAIQQPPTATVDLSSAVVHESPKKEPQQPAVSPELAASPPPKATFSLPPLAAVKSPVQTTTTITTPIVQPPVASVSLNLSAPVPSASPPLVPSGPTPEHQRLQAAFDQLQTAHSKLNQDAKQLQAALTSMTNEKDIILDEQKRLASELSARDRQIAELKTEMGTLETGGAQLESLQNMVEMLTLDKALAEEQNESSLAELETLKNQYANQELELQLLREQHASLQLQAAEAHQRQLAAAGSGPITAESLGAEQNGIANQKLLEQNALLTDALRKLRDLNLAEKQSSTSRISELEKINSGLAAADAENFKLRADLASAQASVASLKEQLDEALELQDMVEKLSQAKLDAEESVKERTRTVAYLESLVAASEEVEEGYKEFQAQLQSELTEKESNFLDLNERYKLKNLQIEDLQGTNRKFRDLVRQLEAENTVLKQKVVEGVASSPRGGSNANGGGAVVPLSGLAATRSSSLLTLRLKQVRTAHLDALLAGVERDLLSKRYQFLSLYLPGNISVDDRSLGFLQLLERLKSKASVLGRVWARFYGALDGEAQGESHSGAKVTVDYSANGTSPELVLLAYKACLLLASIVHAVENLTSSLYTLDVDAYNSICIRSTSEMTPLENILDAYLMMIQMDTLNELTSLASLVQANWILYSFLIEKVPLHAFVSVGAGQTHAITDELNVLPYQMAVWTVIRKVEGEQEVQKWNDLAASYRQRVSEYKRPQLPSGAVVPSSVPALGTFSLTLSYSAAMAQAYAQLIGDHVNSLVDALRRGRARKLAEVSDERSKKERHEAVGTEAAGALSVNASLEEYSNVEDADIAVYSSLWSDIADACLNNLSLSNQLHHTAVRNYQNSLGGNEEQRTKHEQAAVSLLPHMHAIDGLSQAVALQLAALYQAIRPLLQADSLTQLSTAISAEVVDGPPASPILQKLIALLEGAKPSGSDSSDSLLALLTKLRTELFTTSKSFSA
jgi:hypothetical protein